MNDSEIEALWQQHVARVKSDPIAFAETVMRDDKGVPLKLAGIHYDWFRHVSYCFSHDLKALLMAPFGHGKSVLMAVSLVAFELGRDPGLRVKIVCADDASAVKRVATIRRVMESPEFASTFPHAQADRTRGWTQHELYLQREGASVDPSLQARGWNTVGVGGRADLIVFDDCCDQRGSRDPVQREKLYDVVESTWLSRLAPSGRVVWLGTAWHQTDTTHRLMARPGWCSLVQRVADSHTEIPQEVIGGPGGGVGDDYPIQSAVQQSAIGSGAQ